MQFNSRLSPDYDSRDVPCVRLSLKFEKMRLFPQDLVLLLLLMCGACALYFEDGFDHHYTYSSESDILGFHNVTTVVKVSVYYFTLRST